MLTLAALLLGLILGHASGAVVAARALRASVLRATAQGPVETVTSSARCDR